MVHITDEATNVLDSIRSDALDQLDKLPEGTPEPGLRLLINEDQAALALDVPRDEDQVVEKDGHPVLLIGPDVESVISGATVDVMHGPVGDGLFIENR